MRVFRSAVRRRLSLLVAVTSVVINGCGGGAPPPAQYPPRGGEVGEPLFDDRTPTLPRTDARRSMEARAGDFDGDGDQDLLVAREEGQNALLLNDGNGRFTDASSRIPRESSPHDHEDIAVADFDRDGDLDAIVAAEDDQAKDFYINDGRANFTNAADRLPQQCKSDAVAAADLDNDQDVDVVFGCGGRDMLLLNDGTGRFADASKNLPRGPNWRDVSQDVAIGDIDGDRDPDLVFANEDDNRILLNDGRARFEEAPAGSLPLRPWTVTARLSVDSKKRAATSTLPTWTVTATSTSSSQMSGGGNGTIRRIGCCSTTGADGSSTPAPPGCPRNHRRRLPAASSTSMTTAMSTFWRFSRCPASTIVSC